MDTDQVLTAAEQALARGDIAAGEREITAAWPDITQAPAEARHILGAIRGAQSRFAEAEQLLRSAINDEPDSLRHRIALGRIYQAGGAHGPAADSYAEGLRINASWPGLRVTHAAALYQAGRYAEAEAAARQATQSEPSGEAWDTLSCALREQGKHADAMKAAEEALALRPEHMGAAHSLAAAQLGVGRAQDALISVDALIARGGVGAPVLLTRAAALAKLGRKKDAEAAYAEAAQRWPNDPRVKARH